MASSVSRTGALDGIAWPRWLRVGLPVLAAAVGLMAIGDLASSNATGNRPAAVALVIAAVTPWFVLSVASPHRALFAVLVLTPLAVLFVLGDALGVLPPGGPETPLMIVLLVVGQLVATARAAVAATVVAAAVALVAARAALVGDISWFSPWWTALALALVTGLALRATAFALVELDRARHELARTALAEERRRIAREIHDVVAHTLSVTMLHLGAARLSVHRDPDQAVEALEEAERQGRDSLADIRRIVGVLRTADDHSLATSPGLEDLDELVASYRAGGVDLEAHVDLGGAHVTPAVGATTYRVVQEGITNAVRHGRGHVELTVVDEGDALAIRIANACERPPATRLLDRGHAGGAGLMGMRERVSALGGDVSVGVADGRWVVRARLPIGEAP